MFNKWSRNGDPEFNSLSSTDHENLALATQNSDYVLLAIKDGAIAEFIKSHSFLDPKKCVHFSGALVLPEVHSAHPLMTFHTGNMPLEIYERICFVTEEGKLSFSQIFPQLKNPNQSIDGRKKALYHSLCVTGSNFTNILWQEVLRRFASEFSIEQKNLQPFMEQTFANILRDPFNSLTGPLVRGDQKTIDQHLQALDSSLLKPIYQDFVKLYERRNEVHL